MKIAITGGTGFVGGHLARSLARAGHEVVIIARGVDRRDEGLRKLENARYLPVGIQDEDALAAAFTGCDAIAHCAGINREMGDQTFRHVHVVGTQKVVRAAQRGGVRKILLLSFLRARPDCRSGYHESKWVAEEIVRQSGLDYTILKAGVIYGKGDHMLDHLSRAFHTLPLFAFVGLNDRRIRPTAVEDVVRIMEAALAQGRLSHRTVPITGPEELSLRAAVRRVARVVGKKPVFFRMPVALHYLLAWLLEQTMAIPLISIAQVRILSEGLVQPLACGDSLPHDLAPETPFSETQIRRGLPPAEPFGLRDCRCLVKVGENA